MSTKAQHSIWFFVMIASAWVSLYFSTNLGYTYVINSIQYSEDDLHRERENLRQLKQFLAEATLSGGAVVAE